MNATFNSIASVLCVLLLAELTHQMVLDSNAEESESASTTTESLNVPNVSPTAAPTEGQSCSTARGVAGSCVQRQFCEYSTSAIDLTLYMPHGYKRPCVPSEVCCPAEFLRLAAPAPDAAQADAAFAFDEDD